MVFREVAAPRVLKVENADDLVLVDERDAEFRSRLRVHGDVPRVFAYVRNENRLTSFRRSSYEAITNGYVVLEVNVLLEAQRETMLELSTVFVEQQNGE